MKPSAISTSSPRQNEEQLLFCCARTRIGTQMEDRIRALVRGPMDWDAAFAGAQEHGVLPLLCRNLLAVCPADIPQAWRERFSAEFLKIAQRNLYLTAEMIRLSALLDTEHLLAIPYKGPLLAALAYGDLALRQFVDLDFALLQRDIPAAEAILLREGYAATFGEITTEEAVRLTRSEYQYRRPEGNVIAELKTEMTLRYFPTRLDFEAMSHSLTRIPLGGREAFTFSVEDTLLLLSVHGAKHFWERLLWIADIAELVQSSAGVDWNRALARSEELKAGRMLRLALYVAHLTLDAPLPADVLKLILADSTARKLGEIVRARFRLHSAAPPAVFERFRFRVNSRENLWQGIPYAIRLATSPANPDREDLPLPGWLSGLRVVLRPVLLMKRYGVRRPKVNQDH